MENVKITGADYLTRILKQRTDVVFGVTGGVIVNMFDSLAKGGIKIVNTHHEQSGSMAADAYSRVSPDGKVGVNVTTSGPGILNAASGVACSHFDSIPTITISGQVPKKQIRKNRVRQYGFQEVDVTAIFKEISKECVLLADKDTLAEKVETTVRLMETGRPGPIVIDICDDVQREEISTALVTPRSEPLLMDALWEYKTSKITERLAKAKRPVLIVGGGVRSYGRNTEEMVMKFAEQYNLPVALTWATIDMLDDNHPLNMRDFGVTSQRATNIAIQESDLLIVFGSRLDTHEAGANYSSFAPNAYKIIVDVDATELAKEAYDLPICQELGPVLTWLLDEKNIVHNLSFISWAKKIKSLRSKYPICPQELYDQKDKVNPYVLFDYFSKIAKPNSVILTDAGSTLTWTMQGWKIKKGQRLITAFNHSPMGYSVPASMGAYYARPDHDIICFTGDGGLQMNIQELNTIVANKIPVKIFVVNNHEYGMIKQTQDTWLKSRYVASDGPFPDILNIAKAYELPTWNINNHAELDKIQEAMAYQGPVLVNIEVNKCEKIIPKLTFGCSIDNPFPPLPQGEFDSIKSYLRS
jgi:acetolactate synthase I/II/III large subunit